MKQTNKKIPTFLSPPPKTEIDGKITDLSSKTVFELSELLERQAKLLSNKFFIAKLPDKGAKIQAFHDKILKQLKAKQEEEKACNLLQNLKLNETDKQYVQDIEWEGKIKQNKNIYLDSDDDSDPEDVLQILSQNTIQEKKVKVIQPEKPLISNADLIRIGEIPHVKYIVDKTEHNKNSVSKVTGQFKPYKTTKSDVHNPEKEIHRKKHKHWEVTAATPPPILHCPAQILSIEESLTLQKSHNIHLKEIEAQHAAEKLLARAGIKMPVLSKNTSVFGQYRNEENKDSDDSVASDLEGSDKEVYDEEPERGGVVFTVIN